MSTHPRIESRVNALERRQLNLEAHTEDLSGDMEASFKQLSDSILASFKHAAEYDIQTEKEIDTRFKHVDTRFDKIENRLDKIETQSDDLKSKMQAIADDLKKSFDAQTSYQIKQEEEINERFNTMDERLTNMETLLTQILDRLPK